MVPKRHLNQTKSRHIDEGNNTPVNVEPMNVLFDTFVVLIAWKALETKIQKDKVRGKEEILRELILT